MKTPQLTRQVIQFLEDNEYNVENTSYGNDLTDSVLVNGEVKVFLPNSFVDDESKEWFDKFCVIHHSSHESFPRNTDELLETLKKLL
jgi:hypothetical protein